MDVEDRDSEDLLNDFQDVLENRDLFSFVLTGPPTASCSSGEPQASSSTGRIFQPPTAPPQTLSLDDDEDTRIEEEDLLAGKVIRMDARVVETWKVFFSGDSDGEDRMEVDGEDEAEGRGEDVWRPFASELDWRVAMWIVREDVGQNSMNRFLSIPGVVEKLGLSYKDIRQLYLKVDDIPERASWKTSSLAFPDRPDDVHLVRYRDIIEAIKALLGNPAYAKDIVYRPRRAFTDSTKTKRIFTEMWTGIWWKSVQTLLPEGAAVAPVIISTDKTQLTQFSGNKQAYPVYLTLGNIPRAIRRKPSMHACILLGYLPVSKVDGEKITKRERKARSHRLFHEAMRLILKPLQHAGVNGIEVTGGDGSVRRVHPILAAYVADYPEQCLVTCSKYGTCPKCNCPSDKLQEPVAAEPRTSEATESILRQAAEQADLSEAAREAFRKAHNVVGGATTPFWADLPYTNIHLSITPDVLHQLYQGVFKHLVSWCQELLGEKELDRRIRSMPPAFGVRHFKNGVSNLAQITGSERKGMARILLACLVGKYPTHDDDTLKYLADALKTFHEHKDVLVKLGIRDHLNIPKFHSLLHYVESIRLFGTTDNYNTEMFERLHIDLAKDAWRATNHRDEFPQMMRWVTRQEKMMLYEVFQKERQVEEELEEEEDVEVDTADADSEEASAENPCPGGISPAADAGTSVKIAKYAPSPHQHVGRIQDKHGAPGFTAALVQFINDIQPPELRLGRADLAQTFLPFERVDVYHQFKFKPIELSDGREELDAVKAIPARPTKHQKARFDTVIVLDKGDAESTGVIACIRVPQLSTRPSTLHNTHLLSAAASMSAVDKRLIDILAVVSSARYEDIAKLSGICKLCGELRHVAVVLLRARPLWRDL
ncbi:hypothetical protein EVJ58_g2643 [Rhodofomes roseus]|uniref:Uncharacterized protein n=1 Tax=Rhodofomes roseus TaxID=34475 RepID=A0A4Y9YRU8_9APHY|nr:hypothetical protein EVJ58_g2643 [Rhodofomes roseus]